MASLHFCSECNNLLYPRADPQRRIMEYGCRMCPHSEIVQDKDKKDVCVYRNDLLTVTKEQVGFIDNVGDDATLGHRKMDCPRCGHDDAVYFQDQSKRKETRMTLFYVCSKCDSQIVDPRLQLPSAEDG